MRLATTKLGYYKEERNNAVVFVLSMYDVYVSLMRGWSRIKDELQRNGDELRGWLD